jgi:hypothetical protein
VRLTWTWLLTHARVCLTSTHRWVWVQGDMQDDGPNFEIVASNADKEPDDAELPIGPTDYRELHTWHYYHPRTKLPCAY